MEQITYQRLQKTAKNAVFFVTNLIMRSHMGRKELRGISMICSAISIVSTLCVNVLLKKKDYGIKIAFGSTKERIILSLCFEMLFLNIISGAAAFGLSYRSFAGNIIQSYRDIYLRTLCSTSLVCLIGLMMLLTILVLFVPVKLLKRYNPAVLIKEEE